MNDGGVPYQLHLTRSSRDSVESACVASDLHLFSDRRQLYKGKLPTCPTAEGQTWECATERVSGVRYLLFRSKPAGVQDWASRRAGEMSSPPRPCGKIVFPKLGHVVKLSPLRASAMCPGHFFKTCARGRLVMGWETGGEDAYERRVKHGEGEEETLIRKGAPNDK